MARAIAPRVEKSTDEQWETTTQAVTWVKVTAANGDMRQVKVGGRKGARFKISFDDRVANQDEIVVAPHDPFTNGLLFRLKGTEPVHPPQQADDADFSIESLDAPKAEAEQMMAFADLRAILGTYGDPFRSSIARLNEVNLRRLTAICEDLPEVEQPTVAQQAALKELMAGYKPGGQQKSYADFMRGSTGPALSAAGTPL